MTLGGGAWLAGMLLAFVTSARAVNIGVAATKLVVLDHSAQSGRAKLKYTAIDPNVTKGSAEDLEQISVRFEVRYAEGAPAGAFTIPAGTSNGWRANTDRVATYANRLAPGGPSGVRRVVIKSGSGIKLAAQSLGDFPLDITTAGAPSGSVFTAVCIVNGPTEYCHCSEFSTCLREPIADGAGAKLSCRNGRPDTTCAATQGRCLGSADCVLDDWNGDASKLVACGGDSNTVTYNMTPSWCDLLSGYLDGVATQPLGAGGTLASDDPGYFLGATISSHYYLDLMLATWNKKPDIIVLAWGTNDVVFHTPEEIVPAIDTLVVWMRSAGIVPLVASVPRRCDGDGRYDAAIASVNAQLAAAYGPCLIDFTKITPPTAEWYVDCLHLNAAGQERRAIAAYQALKSAPRACASGTIPPD